MTTYLIYNSILLICAIFSYIAEKTTQKNIEFLARFVVFLALFIPASLRYYTGTDYGNYERMFYDDFSLETREILWVYLNKFVQFLNLDFQWVIVFASFLIYYPLCFKLKKMYFFIGIVLYILLTFYFKSYNGIRQMVAVSFILWSFICYEDKKYFKTAILYLISIGFHSSTLFILPLFLLSFVKINFKTKFLPFIFLVIFIILVFRLNFISISFDILNYFDVKYIRYFDSKKYMDDTELGSGIGVFIKSLTLLLAVVFYSKILKKYPNKVNILNFSLFYIIAYILAAQAVIYGRLRDLLIFVPILISGYAIYSVPKFKNLVLIIILTLNLISFEKDIISQDRYNFSNEIYPYYSIFYKGTIK